jgi:hypothetical protein
MEVLVMPYCLLFSKVFSCLVENWGVEAFGC